MSQCVKVTPGQQMRAAELKSESPAVHQFGDTLQTD